MTPPRAVVEALADWLEGLGQHTSDAYLAEGVSAVLAAHYAGEVEGEWEIERRSGLPFDGGVTMYRVARKDGSRWFDHLYTESEARRVAHALNYTPTGAV